MDLGIGMIHQHFMLVDSLTVVENLVLGLRGGGVTLSIEKRAQKLSALSKVYGFDIDLFAEIWKSPIGMRQRVEILKVLYRGANVIILDEPTNVLAPNEIESFLEGLQRPRDQGKTIIFITHKLEEVTQVGDRITVMRNGRVTAELDVGDTSTTEMARLVVGRDVVLEDIEMPHADRPNMLGLRWLFLTNDAAMIPGVLRRYHHR